MPDNQGSGERVADFATRNLRWNATLLITEAVLFTFGLSLMDGDTVIPTLLRRLGAGDSVIGLYRFVQTIGFTIPSLLAAHAIHGKNYHKPFLVLTCAIGRLGLLALPILLWMWSITNPTLLVASILIAVGLFWLMDGFCVVSWFDIVAKAIPSRIRGRFFGWLQVVSGAAAVLAAGVVDHFVGSSASAFPQGYIILSGMWCGLLVFSIGLLYAVREPSGTNAPDDGERLGLLAYLRLTVPFLREHYSLRLLILTRMLIEGAAMGVPFYILHAQENLKVGAGAVAIYLVSKAAGRVLTGPLWGWLMDKKSASLAFQIILLCMLSVPVMALAAAKTGAWIFPVMFFVLGSTQDGIWTTGSTLLMQLVSEKERPRAVGIYAVCLAPASLFGLAGGIMAAKVGYAPVFMCAGIIGLAALLTGLRIPRKVPCGN